MIRGLDVSKWQGNINFDLLRGGAEFVFVKATEGFGYKDPQFDRNWSEAKRVGLPRGAYHFARPDLGNHPHTESDWFCNTTPLEPGDVLALDFEVKYSDPVNWCLEFLKHTRERIAFNPVIYINLSTSRAYDWSPVVKEGFGLWLAYYDNTSTRPTTPWSLIALKQYTSSAAFPGISGNVDADYFYGTTDQFKKYGAPTPPPPPPSVPTPEPAPIPAPVPVPEPPVPPVVTPEPPVPPSVPPEDYTNFFRVLIENFIYFITHLFKRG